MVARCIFKELPLGCFWGSWFIFLVAGTVHVMMSLETPQMSRKHLWGFLFLSAASGRLTQRVQEAEADLSRREKTWKNLQKRLAKWPSIWYYTWAPSAETKEWLLSPSWEAKRKEPIDVRKFRLAPRKRERSKFDGEIRITKNFEKRAWQKITSVIK